MDDGGTDKVNFLTDPEVFMAGRQIKMIIDAGDGPTIVYTDGSHQHFPVVAKPREDDPGT